MSGVYLAALTGVSVTVTAASALLLTYRTDIAQLALSAGHRLFALLSPSLRLKLGSAVELAGAASSTPAYLCLGFACSGAMLTMARLLNSSVLTVSALLLLLGISSFFSRLLRKARFRTKAVVGALPAHLDSLAMLLACGLPLMAALQKSASVGKENPLRSELKGLLIRIRAGAPADEELQNLANRYRCREINLFVSALKHARRSGTELAGILKDQARQRRQELFVTAEQQALEAPVKLMLPLITCIFPGALIVLVVVVSAKLMWGL